MQLGLGTGSTVAYLLPALAERDLQRPALRGHLAGDRAGGAASSGLDVETLDELGELDLAIDGADQVDPHGWLIKGGGGAHTREKIVAAAARRFVVIVSAEKAVPSADAAGAAGVACAFGVQHTLAAARARRSLRDVEREPRRRADRRLPRPDRRPARAGRAARARRRGSSSTACSRRSSSA